MVSDKLYDIYYSPLPKLEHFLIKNLEQLYAYVIAYMKFRTNLQLIIYNEFLCITLVELTLIWSDNKYFKRFRDSFLILPKIDQSTKYWCVIKTEKHSALGFLFKDNAPISAKVKRQKQIVNPEFQLSFSSIEM